MSEPTQDAEVQHVTEDTVQTTPQGASVNVPANSFIVRWGDKIEHVTAAAFDAVRKFVDNADKKVDDLDDKVDSATGQTSSVTSDPQE